MIGENSLLFKRVLKKNSPLWFIQRTVIVIKERRLPQFKIIEKLSGKTYIPSEKKIQIYVSESKEFQKKNEFFRDYQIQKDFPNKDKDCLEKIKQNTNQDHTFKSKNNINKYFDKIYIINLAKRPERKAFILQQVNRLAIDAQVFNAIDGYSDKCLSQYYTLKNSNVNTIISPGCLGLLQTQIELLTDAIRNNYGSILVMEDDVLFSNSFHSKFNNCVNEIPAFWKLLYLGASQHSWEDINLYCDKPLSYYHAFETDGGFAVGISNSVFQEILSEIQKYNAPFDTGALRKIQQKYPRQSFVLFPNICIAKVNNSDIGNQRKINEIAKKFRWDIDQFPIEINQDLVSIVITTHNSEDTILETIDSLINQTYTKIEIIIVDDNSSDLTEKIINKKAKRDPRIKFIKNKYRVGEVSSRNIGIRATTGQYITYVAAGEISIESRIAYQISSIIENNAYLDVGFKIETNLTLKELSIAKNRGRLFHTLSENNKKDKIDTGKQTLTFDLSTSMYSRDFFNKFGLFLEELTFEPEQELIERAYFIEYGVKFDNSEFVISKLLSNTKSIQNVYSYNQEILSIFSNISMNAKQRKGVQLTERKEVINNYRSNFSKPIQYNYPTLNYEQE